MKRKVLDYRNPENENGDNSAKRQKQPTNSSSSNPFPHERIRRVKYYINITGRTEIWVDPDAVKEEISQEGKNKHFVIENNTKIYLYPASEIEPTKKIIQSYNKKQKMSHLDLDRYFTSLSSNAAIIWVHPDEVKREKLARKKEQRFIIENNTKIVLYPPSEIEPAKKIIQQYNKKQNTSSSTTSNVAHPSSSFTSSSSLTANRLPVVTAKELFDAYNNNNGPTVGSQNGPTSTSQYSNILDPTHLDQTMQEQNPSVGWTYETAEYLLFHNVPDGNSPQNANAIADANSDANTNANFNKSNS